MISLRVSLSNRESPENGLPPSMDIPSALEKLANSMSEFVEVGYPAI